MLVSRVVMVLEKQGVAKDFFDHISCQKKETRLRGAGFQTLDVRFKAVRRFLS